MVPFHCLPELKEVNIRNGHAFETSDIEVEAGGVKVQLFSNIIWLPDAKPVMLEDADRLILYRRKHVHSSGEEHVVIYIGLANNREQVIAKSVDGAIIIENKKMVLV
jgi:hypothetical protein